MGEGGGNTEKKIYVFLNATSNLKYSYFLLVVCFEKSMKKRESTVQHFFNNKTTFRKLK